MTKNLDPILEAAAPGETIKLEPGVYTTMGVSTNGLASEAKRSLKEGCTLEGAAATQGITTIICIRPLTSEGGDASVIRGLGRNTVRNVSVDGGVPAGATATETPYPGKRNLVFLLGAGNKIENVIGRRQYGVFGAGRESFGLSAWGTEAEPSEITNCQVTDMVGNYATAIQATVIRQCLVNFPRPLAGVRAFRAAFNMGDTVNGIVEDCEAWWAMAGVYMDWKSCRGLNVRDNAFYGCDAGLWVNAQQEPAPTEQRLISGLTFERNQVYLNPASKHVNGVLLDHSTTDGKQAEVSWHGITNVRAKDNQIAFLPGEPIQAEDAYAANVCDFTPAEKRTEKLGITDVVFENNAVDSRLVWRTKGQPAVSGYVLQKIAWQEI